MENVTNAAGLERGRWYVRCADCLAVSVVASEKEPRNLSCGVCDGRIECMGRVWNAWAVKTEAQCPCDERCTNATGPNCSCSCGGKNHGSKLLVEVVTGMDAATITPVGTPVQIEKRRAIASEWAAAREAALAKLNATAGAAAGRRKRAGFYLSGPEFAAFQSFQTAMDMVREARALRSQAGRLKRLERALAVCR